MSEMLERVARALGDVKILCRSVGELAMSFSYSIDGPFGKIELGEVGPEARDEAWRKYCARAAIEAMRLSSEKMAEHGAVEIIHYHPKFPQHSAVTLAHATYRAMIDEALK